MDWNTVSLVHINSHCKGEVIVHGQQKSPWLYPYFHLCTIALWTSLQLENTSTIEMNTDWKSLQIYNPYIFVDLKRPWNNWLKSKIIDIEENLNETVKHFSKVKFIQISCKKSLILDVSAIERPVLGVNVSWDLKMMPIIEIERCPLLSVRYIEVFLWEFSRHFIHSWEKCVRYREVSAIKDVRYEEVSL